MFPHNMGLLLFLWATFQGKDVTSWGSEVEGGQVSVFVFLMLSKTRKWCLINFVASFYV